VLHKLALDLGSPVGVGQMAGLEALDRPVDGGLDKPYVEQLPDSVEEHPVEDLLVEPGPVGAGGMPAALIRGTAIFSDDQPPTRPPHTPVGAIRRRACAEGSHTPR